MDFKAGSLSGAKLLQSVNELPRLKTYYTPNMEIVGKNPLLEEQRMEHGINAIVDVYSDSLLPVIEQEEETEESDYEHLRMTLYLHYFFSQAQAEGNNS